MSVWLELHPKIKRLVRWAFYTLLLFVGIYLILFLGLWRVFDEGDPIKLEALTASVLAAFCVLIDELHDKLELRIRKLEQANEQLQKRVEHLEAICPQAEADDPARMD